MPVPVVGTDPGPDWALNINACLSILDQHNHSAGQGVRINPSGMDINADLPFNNNNLTTARSIRFQPQLAVLSLPADLGCIYESGVDLYYNDGAGNVVRMTQGGNVAGAAGSITGLVSPASASYSSGSQTFIFQSNVNTPANIDGASFIFRNNVANSKGLTLQPPAAMGSDESLVLPSPVGVLSFLTLDTSGNISGSVSSVGGITNSMIADNTIVTPNKLAPATTTSASLVGVFSTGSTFNGNLAVPGMTLSITTNGRPIMVCISGGRVQYINNDSTSWGSISLQRDGGGGTVVATWKFGGADPTADIYYPTNFTFMDDPGAGTHTYSVLINNDGTSHVTNGCTIEDATITAFPL